MSESKMRGAFEAACRKHSESAGFGESEYGFVRSIDDPECYADSHTQAAWWAWQESREEIEIELPSRYGNDGFDGLSKQSDGYLLYADEVVKAVEAAGVKATA